MILKHFNDVSYLTSQDTLLTYIISLLVHFIGELVGATGFGGANIFAKWKIDYDQSAWRVIEGSPTGRTWAADRSDSLELGIWNDPVD